MNFGQNLSGWLLPQLQWIVIVAIGGIGVFLAFKREASKMLGFTAIAIVAVLLVFNTTAVKDLFLTIGNRVIGA